MSGMVSLKRPPADLKKQRERLNASPQPYTSPDDQGLRLELEHHHLMALKGDDGQPIAGGLKSGDGLTFHGVGKVERSESRSTPDGERHSATVRIHRGAVERGKSSRKPGTPSYPKEANEYLSRASK
jgi:hypothetical protein